MKWPFDPRKLRLAEYLFVLFLFGMALGYLYNAYDLLTQAWWKDVTR